MDTKIYNYYDDSGNLLKRVTRTITTIDLDKSEYGEKLTSPTLKAVIYEDNVKTAIELILTNAKKKPMNILLYGSAGTGKTTTGKMLAVELKRPFVYLNGQMSQTKVLEIITHLKPNSLVLFDEIHNMPDRVAEIMYPAIQDGEIGIEGKVVRLDNIMFIGTTTEPQMLPKPLKDRFKQIELEELSKDKLKELLNLKIADRKVIELLLNHSTNIRVINNLLDMMEMYGEYSKENLIKVFQLRKINLKTGLSELQERYLDILRKQNKPVSLRAICLILAKSEDYIKLEVEGELIKKELINVSSRGRELNG